MTTAEALLVADHGGDYKAACLVLAEEVRMLRADLLRENEDHKQAVADVDALVAAERELCIELCYGSDDCDEAARRIASRGLQSKENPQ